MRGAGILGNSNRLCDVGNDTVQLNLNTEAIWQVKLPDSKAVHRDTELLTLDNTEALEITEDIGDGGAGKGRSSGDVVERVKATGILRGVELKVGTVKPPEGIDHTQDVAESWHSIKGKWGF